MIFPEIYSFVSANLDLFRFLYSMLIAFICLIIVIKTDRLFRVSHHQGIRYFRNAFFFYGVAFVFRYLTYTPNYSNLMKGIFEFFMVMAGLFLLYSLVYKKFEKGKPNRSSLFNYKTIILYTLAIIVVILDFLSNSYDFLFFSQIILFTFASIISYKNYKNRKETRFLKLYFGVMFISFISWTANCIFANFLGGRLRWLAIIYIFNIMVFLVFLYGVIKITKGGTK